MSNKTDLKKIKKLLGNNVERILSELDIDFQKNGENISSPFGAVGQEGVRMNTLMTL